MRCSHGIPTISLSRIQIIIRIAIGSIVEDYKETLIEIYYLAPRQARGFLNGMIGARNLEGRTVTVGGFHNSYYLCNAMDICPQVCRYGRTYACMRLSIKIYAHLSVYPSVSLSLWRFLLEFGFRVWVYLGGTPVPPFCKKSGTIILAKRSV